MKNVGYILFIAAFLVAANIYSSLPQTEYVEYSPPVLRLGVLPDENPENLKKKYSLLLDHLSSETGLEFRLVLPSNYSELITLFHNKEIDLAYFGGLTFIKANISDNAEPLVMRDVDTRFTSSFLIPGNAESSAFDDLKDKKISFGSRLSTSGNLMPRYFLQSEKKIVPEDFFSEVSYSGAHDKTAYLVRDGKVDIGVANSEIVETMLRDGRLQTGEIDILWVTPPYPDYVWAVQKNINRTIKIQTRDAFLILNVDDDKHKDILDTIGAGGFVPAGVNDFKILRETAKSLNLLDVETK